MHRDADVAIVGAGPAGCAAAIRLGTHGYRVLLIDRATFPRDKPCGDYCDPGAVALLDALGVLPSVQAAGAVPIDGMRIVAQDGTAIHPQFPAGRHGLLIRRLALDANLVGGAARTGADVLEGTRVLDLQPRDGHVILRTDPPGTLSASMAIVCDGMHSSIARKLGLLSAIPPRRYTVGAYFSGLAGPPRGELHLGPGLYCGVARFGDGSANVCMALPRSRLRRGTADRAFIEALGTLPRLAAELSSARREGRYRSAGPIGFRSNHVVTDRVVLAGDAAAQVDPLTGQGIFFALRSGMLAADVAAAALTAGDASRPGLARYADQRRTMFGPKLRVARLLQSLALKPRLTPVLIRRLRARPALARELIGAAGDVSPARQILALRYVVQLVAGRDALGA